MPQPVTALPVFNLVRGAATRAAALFLSLQTASRKDSGCVKYTCYFDAGYEDRVLILEEWASEMDLVEHNKQPHVAAFLHQITPLLAEPFTMTKLTPIA